MRQDKKIKTNDNSQRILLIALSSIILAGCATPQEKLKQYGCRYFPAQSGFCCKEKVPEYDHYIFNCAYAEEITVNGEH
jgi:hypothetical protein